MLRKNSDGKHLRRWETAALLSLCLTLCAGAWAQARQSAISSRLVRLHVVAVSDDAAEQALKLRVRDAVLAYLSPLLEDVEEPEQARELIAGKLPEIAQAAGSAAEGRGVRVSLRRESFPTRAYGGFTLPAGEYESLRVVLGQGRGHNWWCVVFPPLCLSAAQAEDLEGLLDEEDLKLITGEEGYALRFRLVELWGELLGWLKDAGL